MCNECIALLQLAFWTFSYPISSNCHMPWWALASVELSSTFLLVSQVFWEWKECQNWGRASCAEDCSPAHHKSAFLEFLLLDPVVCALEKPFLALEMHFLAPFSITLATKRVIEHAQIMLGIIKLSISLSNHVIKLKSCWELSNSLSLSNHVVSDARIKSVSRERTKIGIISVQNRTTFPSFSRSRPKSTYFTCDTVYT